MIIRYDVDFIKTFKKLPVIIRKDFKIAIDLFYKDPFNKKLDNHELKREWDGHRSIDVNVDWRAIYKERKEGDDVIAYFSAIGIHEELYV